MPRLALTKRHPGKWVTRSRIWMPDGASVAVEGQLSPERGRLILALLVNAKPTEAEVKKIAALSEELLPTPKRGKKTPL